MWIILLIIIIFILAVGVSVKKELKKSGGYKNYKAKRLTEGGLEKRSSHLNTSKEMKVELPDPFLKYSVESKQYELEYDCAYDFEEYPFEIVGESSYQENIKKFAIQRENKGCFIKVIAKIIREPTNKYDKNACRVVINGLTVGYLPRNNAESWVRLLNKLNIHETAQINVNAVIVGGGSAEYSYGVRLNIPTRIANSAKYIKELKEQVNE
ncbi:HIRAN domain-containing protein [Acinetobacter oleivorans]|uniref:HIRAN domain-containing protein n=1 Tax=Acinetobacter TaxID=469 RepID=UPI00125FF834|nr:HIRAN domain-containing protein [Acinetobacter oleivorans]